MKPFRADSLDALRGLTIAMMVLCGTIINWVLPPWMSHCQVPATGFDPSIYGITWVDLVFPFFLFAMGAAIPFSICAKLEKGERILRVLTDALWRGLKLAFFAIFIQNMYPWILADAGIEGSAKWLTTLAAFLLLFPLFTRIPWKMPNILRRAIPVAAIILACWMMWSVEMRHQFPSDYLSTDPSLWDMTRRRLLHILYRSNIIILLLANMATFGTILYTLTIGRPLVRVAILPFIMAILLCRTADGSWQQTVAQWTPAEWLYRFEFLKYLFIIVPGTIAGEQLRRWTLSDTASAVAPGEPRHTVSTASTVILSLAIIVVNVTLLFGRHLVANLWITILLALLTSWFAHRLPVRNSVVKQLVYTGAYILVVGLFFEAFEGGIRKDDSTFSYYFVTSGLAFYCLAMLVIICDIYGWKRLTAPFTGAGRNPMIAYVAPTMLLFPVMNLLGVGDSMTEFWASTWWLAVARGLLFTALAVAVACLCSRLRIYWRT